MSLFFSLSKIHFSDLFKAKSLFSFYAPWEGQIKMNQKWNATSLNSSNSLI